MPAINKLEIQICSVIGKPWSCGIDPILLGVGLLMVLIIGLAIWGGRRSPRSTSGGSSSDQTDHDTVTRCMLDVTVHHNNHH